MTNWAEGLQKVLDPSSDDKPYYEAIGRFVVAYAQLEGVLHTLARRLSGLKDDKARIVFSGMRLGDLNTRIRGLLRVTKRSPKVKADIEACLSQCDVIGIERDKMVHRYVQYATGTISISNEMTAKSPLAAERDLFTINDLMRLQIDCWTIVLRIMHIMGPAFIRAADKKELRMLHEPWQYKPRQRQTQKKQSRKKATAKLPTPPRSSRA